MGKKMLIDAAHREETRVVIVSGNRVENFDFESEAKRPLRGNIYLAKVTRVEPSLQAAFIEYGGNRHGFLAFSEIHPDYYQIPVADREKLLAEEAEDNRAEAEEDYPDDADDDAADESGAAIAASSAPVDSVSEELNEDSAEVLDDTSSDDAGDAPEAEIEEIEDEDIAEEVTTSDDDVDDIDDDDDIAETLNASDDDSDEDETDDDTADEDSASDDESGEELNGDSEKSSDDEKPRGRSRRRGNSQDRGNSRGRGRNSGSSDRRPARRTRSRHYKIQEVIKRRQILLVQVVKEERGNKGAALTTYLSLAGRYCVLMPNTARGGGISRKITNAPDRRRLKEAMNEMEVSDGMGLIVRTAGANRTKVEIKRDFDYLLRLWENIRDLTLKSSAPALIYEEGDLIKRSIRDQYSKDIDEIIVHGDAAYKEAKEFMRMLMPSHAKNVKQYKERDPLLQRYGVQGELDSLLEPTVTLKSGGYIVINPTEALVSIDVNSGKSTKEHNIEATALSTNMEAAEEIARQLRLRDMAGLIVIDFIDMDESRNNRAVERKLKDSLKQDRARIQVGRISSFGLMEMSRQRMRSGVLEGSTDACPHCKGTGIIRSIESAALQVLRAIEAEALKGKANALDVSVAADVAVFILNQKRATLLDIEKRCRVSIYLLVDGALMSPDFSIKRTDDRTPDVTPVSDALSMESAFDEDDEDDDVVEAFADEVDEEDEITSQVETRGADNDDDEQPKRKRRRRRRGGRKTDADGNADDAASENTNSPSNDEEEESTSTSSDADSETSDSEDLDEDGKPRKRRRRGRRGGRRHRRTAADEASDSENDGAQSDDTAGAVAKADGNAPASGTASDEDKEAPVLVSYSSDAAEPVIVDTAVSEPEPEDEPVAAPEPEMVMADAEPAPPVAAEPAATPDTGPAKRGWWQRRS